MVFVVGDFPVHRPEVGMDIEEIHVNRHLDPVILEIFLFIDPVNNHDLAVSDGSDHLAVPFRNIPVRNPVEPEHKEGECQQDDRYRNRYVQIVNEYQRACYQD